MNSSRCTQKYARGRGHSECPAVEVGKKSRMAAKFARGRHLAIFHCAYARRLRPVFIRAQTATALINSELPSGSRNQYMGSRGGGASL
jgi:hypothetical protein